jgi:enoyl-CoA hydratase/carnithine racemase
MQDYTLMSAADAVLLHRRDRRGVHQLTFNDPTQFNTLGESMLASLQQALQHIAQDSGARVLVLSARGKAFCAGHNLKEMRARPELVYYQDLFARCSRIMLSLRQLPIAVIAAVQGVATAAGCQLVAQCDLAVVAEGARFGVNGIDVGLFCATPSVALSRNILPKQAMEMLLTGQFIDAHEACRRGLVNRVVAQGQLDQAVEDLVQSIVAKPAQAIALGKQVFYQQAGMGLDAAYQLAGQAMACNLMLDVAQEGVQAFVDKRSPSWPV